MNKISFLIDLRSYKNVRILMIAISSALLIGCGSEDAQVSPRTAHTIVTTQGNEQPTSTKQTIQSNQTVTLKPLASNALSFPPEVAALCAQGQIAWTIVSGTDLSLLSSASCQTTLSSTENFLQASSVRGVLTLSDRIYQYNVTVLPDLVCEREILVGIDDNGGTKECVITVGWSKDIAACKAKSGSHLMTNQTYTTFKQDNGSFPCVQVVQGNHDFAGCKSLTEQALQLPGGTLASLARDPKTSTGAFNVQNNGYDQLCVGNNGLCDDGISVKRYTYRVCPR